MNSKKPETGARLFIGGFPRKTEKTELEEFCSRFGKVKNTDIIPFKQLAFVTFTSKEEATLAMFGIQQQAFKGQHLRVDWAKVRKEKKEGDKEGSGSNSGGGKDKTQAGAEAAAVAEKPQEKSGKGVESGAAAKDIAKDVAPAERYIPGDNKESSVTPVSTVIPAIKEKIVVRSANKVSSRNIEEEEPAVVQIPPEPVKLTPIPNLIIRTHYSESAPPLEITIRDTQSHDIKYTFKVKSLAHLRNFLIQEANGEVTPADLFQTSSTKSDKNILYGKVPVVHIYEDLLGKELLEPRDNKEKRENYLKNREKNNKPPQRINNNNSLPPPQVPLASKKIPAEEIYHLLVSKGYEYVLLNTSANGPTAPLHPEWKPLADTYTFRKGTVLVSFSAGQGFVDTFQFLNQSTNQSYKDLLPILVKYDVCIFNSNKGAFITPEQLQ